MFHVEHFVVVILYVLQYTYITCIRNNINGLRGAGTHPQLFRSDSRLVAYWVTTGLVASSVLSASVAHVLHVQANADGFVRLGYPLHFVTLSEQDALAEGGYVVLVGVPDPARL